MDPSKAYWDRIYDSKTEQQMSWTQLEPNPSLGWILEISPDKKAFVIDVGGGLSVLTCRLLEEGFRYPAVLDISETALDKAKTAAGATPVEWIVDDVRTFSASRKFNIWHDRAVFHFLTDKADRDLYWASMRQTLLPDGYALIATFSPQGPNRCSGLDVMQYDEASLSAELGAAYKLIKSTRQTHLTPWGSPQEFQYCLFQRFP
jgi:trans-aconitate methyltransferase